MNVKTGFRRFISLFISFAIVFSTFAGLLPSSVVFAEDETPGVNIIIKHWHVSEEGGLVTLEETLTAGNKNFNAAAGSSETFAGFAVSAGNDCVTLDSAKGTFTVKYDPNVHLVKVHVFYSEKPKLVPGTEMTVGTGDVAGKYKDTKWEKIDEDVRKNIIEAIGEERYKELLTVNGLDQYIKLYNTSEGLHTDKTATPVYYSDTNNAGTTIEDKKESEVDEGEYAGTRVFDINLEAWYNDQATAKVGLILDASGSMAFISDGLTPMHFDASAEGGYTLPDGITNVQPNVYLTPEQVDKILDKKLTDNSKLSYSDYSYYIFDTRDFTQEFVPLAYWGGETGAKPEYLVPQYSDEEKENHLLGFWDFNETSNTEIINRVTNKPATVYIKDEYDHYTVENGSATHSDYFKNGGHYNHDYSSGRTFALSDFSRNKQGDSAKPQALVFDVKPTSDTFTVAFIVGQNKEDTENTYGPERILFIGDRSKDILTASGKDYNSTTGYNFYDIGLKDYKHIRFRANNAGNTSRIDSVFDKTISTSSNNDDIYSFVTMVFSKNKDDTVDYKLYKNGKLATKNTTENSEGTIKSENTLSSILESETFDLVLGGGSIKDKNHILYIDDLFLFDAALEPDEVAKLYKNVKEIDEKGYKAMVTSDNTKALDNETDKNVIATYKSALNAGEQADRAGWYFVNSGSNLTNFYGEVGTAKELCGLLPKEVIKNEIDLSKLPQSVKNYFDKHSDDVTEGNGGYIATSGKEDFTGDGVWFNPKSDAKTEDDDPDMGESKTVKEGDPEYYPAITVPDGERQYIDDGYSPCVFFIDKAGYLRCFYNNGSNTKAPKEGEKELRSGVSYVYQKDDNTDIKTEDLQYALGQFAAQLHNATPNSMISAVRFSNQNVAEGYKKGTPKEKGYDLEVLKKLVMLDWTSDTKEISQILSLKRGDDESYGGTLDKVDSNPTDKGLASADPLAQYNYGMTGGTYTWTGFQAYTDILDKRIGTDDKAKKYIILFTDGMDNMLDGGTDTEKEYAVVLANELKKKGYTIFCVVLKNDSFDTGASGEEKTRGERVREYMAKIAGNTSTDNEYDPSKGEVNYAEKYEALSSQDSPTRYIFEANDVTGLTSAFTDEILDQISSNLISYTVRDYIDPRFDLVDNDGNTIVLEKGGKVSGVTLGDAAEDYPNAIGTITNIDGKDATLCYDSAKDRYYLDWANETIPGTTPGQNSLTIWSRTFRVKAKDDFIGGNAVLSNGNDKEENWVFNEKDIDEDNVNADASSGVDDAILNKNETDGSDNLLDPYVSKGFPRTAVNVRLLKPSTATANDVIYMGETINPKEVAGEIIQIVKSDCYWNYLGRYYNRVESVGTNYEEAFENAVKALLGHTIKDKDFDVDKYTGLSEYLKGKGIEPTSINTAHILSDIPYMYLQNQAGDAYTNTVGNADYQGDRTGTLTYMIIQNTPDDELGGTVTTTDTNKRSYIIWVQFTADQIEDDPDDMTDKPRAEAVKSLVIEKDGEGNGIYSWDSDFKPVAGEEQKERHIAGPYEVDIVKGEIWLDWDIDDNDIEYLTNHFPNLTIEYSVDLKRVYNDIDDVVGTFSFSKSVKDLPKSAEKVKAEFEFDETNKSKYEDMLTKYGLPIGQYTLGEPSITFLKDGINTVDLEELKEFKGFKFKDPVIQNAAEIERILSSDDNYFVGYNAEPVNTADTSDNTAMSSDDTIYLGYGSTGVYDSDGEHKEGESVTRVYTDDRLGLIRITGDPDVGTLSITKNVNYDIDSYGAYDDENTSFTFEVELTNADGSPAVGTFKYKIDDNPAGTIDADNNTIILKKDETATIEGIPVGMKYTVTEVSVPAGYKADSATATGTITEDGEKVSVTNTYSAYGELKFDIAKIIEGRNWLEGEKFTFVAEPSGDDTVNAVEKGDVKMPAGNIVATITKTETVKYPITFNAKGTYHFTIKEADDTDKHSLTYDTASYNVTVKVDEGSVGEAKLEVSYTVASISDSNPTITFTNTAEPITWSFDVTKNLTGRDWLEGEEFEFNVDVSSYAGTDNNVTTPVEFTTAQKLSVNKGNSTAKFGVKFYSTGTYTFTVTENGTGSNGLTYDTTATYGKHTIVVTVGAPTGALEVTNVSVDGNPDTTSLEITNEYKASGTAEFTIQKKLQDKNSEDITDWGEKTFTFNLKAAEDNPEGTVTVYDGEENVVNGTIELSNATKQQTIKIQFADITFTAGNSKEYNFTLTENVPDPNPYSGITYDPARYNIKVTVTDTNSDGIIEPTVVINDAETSTVTFKNTYNPSSASWTPKVTKKLTGRAWTANDRFTFNIEHTPEEGEPENGVTMPEITTATASGENVASDSVDATDATFNPITFTEAGTYTFTVTEEKGTDDNGITYDTSDHKIAVTVEPSGTTGALEVTSVIVDDDPITTSLVITNEYKASASASVSTVISKSLTGGEWGSEKFTFALLPNDDDTANAVNSGIITLPEDITISNGNKDIDQTFGEIRFNNVELSKDAASGEYVKYYNFKIIEKLPGGIDETTHIFNGIVYDTTAYFITVKVTCRNGIATAEVENSSDEITFNNSYSSPVVEEIKWAPAVSKTLKGRNWKEGDIFTFTITPDINNPEGATMPTNTTATALWENAVSDSVGAAFEPITFTEAGTYTFTIKEDNTGITGVTYVENGYTFTVKVTENGGQLVVESVTSDGKDYKTNPFTFVNSYSPAPVDWTPQVTKVIANKEPWESDYSFDFTITPLAGNPDVLNKATGEKYKEELITINAYSFGHVGAFPTVTFKAAGTYVFTIQEKQGTISAVTYDTSPHMVTVTVADIDGVLTITNVSGTDMGSDSNLTIVNTYSTSVTWPPVVEKTIDGREWQIDDAFTFELSLAPTTPQEDIEFVVMPPDNTITLTQADYNPVTKKATRQFAAGVEFKKAGTYQFILKERIPEFGDVNMIYDKSEYIITVNVEEIDNVMVAQPSALKRDENGNTQPAGGNYSFINTYNRAEAKIYVRKELEDWKDGDEFTFDITPNYDGVIFDNSSVTVSKDSRTASFGITFTALGDYTFNITERIDPEKADEIVYAQPQTVTIHVSPDLNGKLTATVVDEFGNVNTPLTPLIFTNHYVEEATLPISVSKVLDGWKDGDEFTFDITTNDATGNVKLPNPSSVTVSKDNTTASFGNITFKAAGTYTFEISERKEKADEIVYAEPQTVTVIVSQDLPGKLTATVVDEFGNANTPLTPLTFTNHYVEEATLPISVSKVLDGWKDGDEFTFDITTSDVTGNVILPNPSFVTVSKDNTTASFGNITFKAAGTYTIEISERKEKTDEIVYADPQTITVSVIQDQFGKLTANVIDGEYENGVLTFINSYKTPDPPAQNPPSEPTASLTLSKVLYVNNTVTNGVGQFRFRIELIGSNFTEGLFNNGVAEVTLASGESITLEGLPAGIRYTVSEYDAYGYAFDESRSSGLSGTLPENGESKAVAVNVYVDTWHPQTPPPVVTPSNPPETPDTPPVETEVELPTEAKLYDEESADISRSVVGVCSGIIAVMLLAAAYAIELKRR